MRQETGGRRQDGRETGDTVVDRSRETGYGRQARKTGEGDRRGRQARETGEGDRRGRQARMTGKGDRRQARETGDGRREKGDRRRETGDMRGRQGTGDGSREAGDRIGLSDIISKKNCAFHLAGEFTNC